MKDWHIGVWFVKAEIAGTLRSLIELEKTTMHDKANQAGSS
jgi:hypothetical protein